MDKQTKKHFELPDVKNVATLRENKQQLIQFNLIVESTSTALIIFVFCLFVFFKVE